MSGLHNYANNNAKIKVIGYCRKEIVQGAVQKVLPQICSYNKKN